MHNIYIYIYIRMYSYIRREREMYIHVFKEKTHVYMTSPSNCGYYLISKYDSWDAHPQYLGDAQPEVWSFGIFLGFLVNLEV